MHPATPTFTHPSGNQTSVRIAGRGPTEVFDLITDIDALPRWNDLIAEIVERPASLEPGAVWRVRMQHGPVSWISRSTVVAYDRAACVFLHRSGTDDGNPSYAEWCWTAAADGAGTALTVRWSLHPAGRIRRRLLAPYRARRLRDEVPASLDRLVAALALP